MIMILIMIVEGTPFNNIYITIDLKIQTADCYFKK